jgi:putative component of membrane protein insertase Oxa1/YidC/SpoIIIJ protein YidD
VCFSLAMSQQHANNTGSLSPTAGLSQCHHHPCSKYRAVLSFSHHQHGTTWKHFRGLIPCMPSQLQCLDCLRSSRNNCNDLEDLLTDSGSATTADTEIFARGCRPQQSRHPTLARTSHSKHDTRVLDPDPDTLMRGFSTLLHMSVTCAMSSTRISIV